MERLLAQRRLVTLLGPGGAGKTRLALELARRSPGVVAWVELSPIADPSLIAHQVLSALGGRSSGQSLAIESVIDLLGDGRCLLVLDNTEHLIEASALFARAILHGCPGTSILATSREGLGVAGEHVWPVPPLSLPELDARQAAAGPAVSEAVALFVERARAVAPRFELDERNTAAVVEICRRVDGLPLALELAAARVRALTPEEIARRLSASFKLLASADRAVDARHRTLEATIDWSFELLDDVERRLLLRLSVFSSGFSIEAAERVCACDGLERERVLDVLMALVDKSLVLAEPLGDECRYRLLEAVRHYGWERLEPAEAEALRELHARTFVELAEAAEPHIFGGAASETWMRRLEAELANLRAALDWALDDPSRVEVALRLGASLHWFWFARGRLREGRRALARALGVEAPADPIVRGHASIALGQVAVWQGDNEAVHEAMEEGARLLERAPDDDFWRAYALCGLAIAHTLDGEPVATRPLIDTAVATARRHRHTVLLPFALYWRALVLGASDEVRRGLEDIDEAVAISRAQGHRPAVGHCLDVAGHLLLAAGDHALAADRLGESLAIHLDTGDHWGIARVLENLAALARRQSRPQRAVSLHAAAERVREAIGSPLRSLERAAVDAALDACRGQLSALDYERAWEKGSTVDLEELAILAAGGDEVDAAERPATQPMPPPARLDATPVLEIRAMGPAVVDLDGAPLEGLWGRPKELLVLLAWHGEGLRREDIGLALWPDAAPDKLRNLFHVTLHRLRKCLGTRDWVVREGERYRLSAAIPWRLDARRFESDVTAALRQLRAGRDVAVALSEALELFRGDFLQGESAGEWHYEIKERLGELWLEATRELARALIARGDDDGAAAALRRLLARDPVDEEASRALMDCALRRGERGEALREYRRLERALREELGVEPGPEVAALYRQVRRGGSG